MVGGKREQWTLFMESNLKMHILINVPCGKDTPKNDIHY